MAHNMLISPMHPYGSCESPFIRPPISEAGINGIYLYGQTDSPVFSNQSFSIHGQKNIVATVASLFCHCRPTAIFRRIIAVIVGAFNSEFRMWFWPHIGIKVFEIMPSFTYFYASPAVIWVSNNQWIVTACFHGGPSVILGCIYASVFAALVYTTTAFYSLIFELCCGKYMQISAMATAVVIILMSLIDVGYIQNFYPAKYFSGKINVFWHKVIIPQGMA